LKQAIGPAADELQVLFITVDPKNDTPNEIRRYLDLFDAKMSGATGTEAELKAVRARYQAMARQVPLEGGGYTIDHSATVFLMGRRGEFLTTIDGHEPDRTASAKIRMALAGQS
jgi:protein SCO1/2